MHFILGRNVMRYQQLFKIKIVKIGVWMTSVPVLVVTPILKCCVVMSTLFNQLNTMTSSQSFDPMKTELLSLNGSKMETRKIDNEYDSQESIQKSHIYLESYDCKICNLHDWETLSESATSEIQFALIYRKYFWNGSRSINIWNIFILSKSSLGWFSYWFRALWSHKYQLKRLPLVLR